ncbi:MAG: dioxygenase [Acidimicrobiia bacterium]|nr:dioxygenase [Acidimicrobiia bacterium]NNF10659.1 dioxygenase [Acidimicrobiia bacterium]
MRFPTGFVGHGAPTNALNDARGAQWRRWAESLPRPSAILSISAHFEQAPPSIGATSTVPLVYDFWGFPQPLYEITYAAPGAPAVADDIKRLLPDAVVDEADRGLDHGTWVPLLHMYPEADIPVVQLSLPWVEDPARMFELGRRLAPLRDDGVFILGSGNLVHNLRAADWAGGPTPGWAADFDAWLGETLDEDRDDALQNYVDHPLAHVCHPTKEHFVPLLVAAGAATEHDEVSFPIADFDLGSVSMRSVQFG